MTPNLYAFCGSTMIINQLIHYSRSSAVLLLNLGPKIETYKLNDTTNYIHSLYNSIKRSLLFHI